MALAIAPPPAVIEIAPHGDRWLLVSSDRLFSGVFMDRRSALRHALAEAECHPGHVVMIGDDRAPQAGPAPALPQARA